MNESAIFSTSGFLPWIEIGDFRIQSYFVIISLVLCLCAIWIPRRAESTFIPARRALDLFIIAMIGGMLGARLLHIFWEEPAYYMEDPWRVFDVMSGGFVWYGGAIGAAQSIWGALRFGFPESRGRSWPAALEWFDFFAPIAAIGYAGGRVACVLTGCCFGRVCEWPFGAHEHAHTLFRFPTQGFAVLWELAVAWLLLRLEKRRDRKRGDLFFVWIALHGLGRIIMESLRADPRGPALGPVTISMGVSLILVACGLLGFLKKPVSN